MDPIDNMAQPFTDSSQHTMIKAAGAAFTGAMIGAQLDHTAFGHWFNTSKVVGFFYDLMRLGIIGLVLYYLYFVFRVW